MDKKRQYHQPPVSILIFHRNQEVLRFLLVSPRHLQLCQAILFSIVLLVWNGHTESIKGAIFTNGKTKILGSELEVRMLLSQGASREHLQFSIDYFSFARNDPCTTSINSFPVQVGAGLRPVAPLLLFFANHATIVVRLFAYGIRKYYTPILRSKVTCKHTTESCA